MNLLGGIYVSYIYFAVLKLCPNRFWPIIWVNFEFWHFFFQKSCQNDLPCWNVNKFHKFLRFLLFKLCWDTWYFRWMSWPQTWKGSFCCWNMRGSVKSLQTSDAVSGLYLCTPCREGQFYFFSHSSNAYCMLASHELWIHQKYVGLCLHLL